MPCEKPWNAARSRFHGYGWPEENDQLLLLAHLAARMQDALEGVGKFLRLLHGEHDGVAAATHILGDLDEASAVVFLQVEEKDFAFADDFLAVQRRDAPRPLVIVIPFVHA